MGIISETLKFEMPPKEKVMLLVKQMKDRSDMLTEMTDFCESARDADKAVCLAAVNQITRDNPVFVQNHLDFIIRQIESKSAQVKLEASEIIANSAKAFPDEATKAMPGLLEAVKDEASVVRWGAACALTEIAKSNNNPKTRRELIRFFKAESKKEKMSSVRNIYFEALSAIGKGKE